jgi:hypothetical protein
MTSSAQPSWLVWHENDNPALGSALHRIAVQGGQGRAELGIARLGKARHGRRIGQACRGTASHCPSSRGKASIGSPAYLSAALFGRQATALRGRRGIAWQGWAWRGTAVRAAAKPEAGAGQLDYIEFSSVLAATERRRYKSVLDSESSCFRAEPGDVATALS